MVPLTVLEKFLSTGSDFLQLFLSVWFVCWVWSEVHVYLSFYLLGEEASMFTRSAITPPEVNGFGWNLGNSEYIVWSWPWRILGAIHAEARAGDLAEVLFFLSGKQRTTLWISGQPIFTKFTHKTWFCETVNPFGNIFWKFALKGLFSKKPWSSSTISDFRPRFLGNDYKSWNRWQVGAPVECWLSIQAVGINSKSFAWPASSVQGRTFLDISGSSV